MSNKKISVVKYFFIYWLILPTAQFFCYLIEIGFEIKDYRINVILLMLFNFIFAYNQAKKVNLTCNKILLSFSSSIQFMLIALILNDFAFLLFLLIVTPIFNFLTFLIFSISIRQTLHYKIFFLMIIFFFGFYIAKPISIYVAQLSKTTNLKRFPNIDLVHQNGEEFVMDKDQLYLLNFWSLNCRACIKKMPNYNDFVKKYPKVEFISVLYAQDDSIIKKARIYTNKFNFGKVRLKDYKQFNDSIKKPLFPYLMIVKNEKVLYSGLPLYKSDFLNEGISELVLEHQ